MKKFPISQTNIFLKVVNVMESARHITAVDQEVLLAVPFKASKLLN